MEIPDSIKSVLTKSANYSLAIKTKSTYKTAYNMLQKCQSETKQDLTFPLNESKALTFIGWCIKRKNKVSTIRSYLSGLKKAHTANNLAAPNLATPLINSVLGGHEKKENQAQRSKKPKRLPCTTNTLRLIKSQLKKSKLESSEQIALYATCTTLFFGAPRTSEALPKSEKAFDPALCVTKKDIKFVKPSGIEGKRSVEITIKNSKANRSKVAETLVIYETGDDICPIKALDKLWFYVKDLPNHSPLFSCKNGKPITPKRLNAFLKDHVTPHLKRGNISGHSFRSGLISIFAKLGYSNDQLMVIGRWSSRAYEVYIKCGKTKRHQMALASSRPKNLGT